MRQRLIFFLLMTPFFLFAQPKSKLARPKLVVGIVVDQMREDFLYRYYNRYGQGGFKRLMNEGNVCRNTFINYLPSFTGPGHASIYTATSPAYHGIASNDWYERSNYAPMYCVSDTSVKAVGGSEKAGKMSPKNLWSTTITDELRLATNKQSKVIAISLKDRASILPGGHLANTAYWMDDTLGNFMTSTYYLSALPEWAQRFNEKAMAAKYMTEWKTLYPVETYSLSTADQNNYEGRYAGELLTTFPHKLSQLKKADIRKTCFGNSILKDFAEAAIEGEQLGMGESTDMLCMSFSSTDYVGHQFGPNSIETEDTYLRLDLLLEEFLNYLDENIGKGNYTLFLTADHGVAHNPQFLLDQKIPAGFFYGRKLKDSLNLSLNRLFQIPNRTLKSSTGKDSLVITPTILDISENFIWFNDSVMASQPIDREKLSNSVLDFVKLLPEIHFAVDMQHIQEAPIPQMIRGMALNGYTPKRCGDILLLLSPGWIDAYSATGTTHGTWNPYDTHIPLLWYGWGIKPGDVYREVYMTDIAATLATLLHIQMPSACMGKCIGEVIKN